MTFNQLKRREAITLLVGAAAWPLAAQGQQGEQMRRIGVLMGNPEGDPRVQVNVAAFRQGLQTVGWTEGRNVQIEYRLAGGDPRRGP
jgi:putative ABC transport system substrate-binding protein